MLKPERRAAAGTQSGKGLMAEGSPSADRLISIINYFASYPKQSFTVADIVKSLGISRATCNAFMVSLAQAGYLYRGSDKRYMLGPAILAIASQAQAAFAPIDVARLEFRPLAEKLDAMIAVHAREGNVLIPQERVASARYLSLIYPPNVRHALHPWGVLFLAPLDDAAIEASFDAATPPLSEDERALERRMVAFARAFGFLFAVHPPEGAKMERLREGEMSIGEFVTELDPDRNYRLLFIMAPVFDRNGHVVFDVAVSGFSGQYRGAEILRLAATILDACKKVSSFTGGVISLGREP